MNSINDNERVFELRRYHTFPGRLAALQKRFREHTLQLFRKHGIESIGYWIPNGEGSDNVLIYLVAHRNIEAARTSWDSLHRDPEWVRVSEDSQLDGKIVEHIESIFMTATDYSSLR